MMLNNKLVFLFLQQARIQNIPIMKAKRTIMMIGRKNSLAKRTWMKLTDQNPYLLNSSSFRPVSFDFKFHQYMTSCESK